MMEGQIKHVTIIGVGLLGGSAALAIKAEDPDVTIAGVGRRQSSLDMALKVGAIDTAHLDAAEAVAHADLVLLATPVGAFSQHMCDMVTVLPPGAVVTDVGSTKAAVVDTAEQIFGREGPFVGSHPMAGSEQKGVSASRADLFAGATCIITPTEATPPELVARVEQFWRTLKMHTFRMGPLEHDRAVARISHLPHVMASLLMMLPDDADLDVAATGFRDATRMASGDPEMWRDILTTNRSAVLNALAGLQGQMGHLRRLLETNDAGGIEAYLNLAKQRRDATIAQAMHDRRISVE
jgi:prephenate dehydrogenase